MADFISKHWEIISSSPEAFIIFAFVVGPLGFGFARLLAKGTIDALRERLAASQDDVARLKDQRDELVRRLQSHGEEIDEIKAALASAPKVHISKEAPGPNDGKDGDVWFQVGE